MRIAILTDAWFPQVNGVVRTLNKTIELLQQDGHEVLCINPQMFRTLPMPTYPDIRLAILPWRGVRRRLDAFKPEAVHLATEGSIGWAGRRYCLKYGVAYTTAYHTRFPEYVRLRAPVPLAWSYAFVRRFHAAAIRTMVATTSMHDSLQAHGFRNLVRWSRGVDLERFHPRDADPYAGLPRPVMLHLGRVAVEKNIEDFLQLDLPGSKVVIGDGPARKTLQSRHPDAHFLGYKDNGDLAQHLAGADVLVFPSRTDTFGLVMLEANASGVPVAAYPVEGPLDVVRNGVNGYLHEDLATAVTEALQCERGACRELAETYSWEACTQQFLENLQPLDGEQVAALGMDAAG
jgi:glycosyltransferase involved in cell wall biosynthesis